MDIKYIIKEKMNFNIQELTDFQEQNKKPGNLNFTRVRGIEIPGVLQDGAK